MERGRFALMRFEDRAGTPIRSHDEWRTYGGPAAAHHWKEGRSAFELARDWVVGDAAQRAQALLGVRPEFAGLVLERGIAEKKTRFDENPRGPRNHDLLVEATTDEGPVVIGVEGKADEPFDASLSEWRQTALARRPTSGAPKRLDGLTASFFGTTLDEDTGTPPLAGLGYQLLSALAGTLADAKQVGAVRAVVLIHEFVTAETADDKHELNEAALDAFIWRLSGQRDLPRTGGSDAWTTDPIDVRGDGRWRPKILPVHVAKLVTRTRA